MFLHFYKRLTSILFTVSGSHNFCQLGTQLSFQHNGTLASLPCWALFCPKRPFWTPLHMIEEAMAETASNQLRICQKEMHVRRVPKGKILAQKWHIRYFFINGCGRLSCVPSVVGRTPQLFHSFTMYVKGASPFLLRRIVHQYSTSCR